MAGGRSCSDRSKIEPIEWFLADVLQRAPYVHLLGFSVAEGGRIAKDRIHTLNGRRTPRYLLAEWTWDRAEAAGYLHHAFGGQWIRSACGFCCYANAHRGSDELIYRWSIDPHAAADALVFEQRALGLNPHAALFAKRTAYDVAREHRLHEALSLAEYRLATSTRALYEVRRPYFAAKTHTATGTPGKGPVRRSVAQLATGSRAAMHEQLRTLARQHRAPVHIDQHGFPRAMLLSKGETYPTRRVDARPQPRRHRRQRPAAHSKNGGPNAPAWPRCARSRTAMPRLKRPPPDRAPAPPRCGDLSVPAKDGPLWYDPFPRHVRQPGRAAATWSDAGQDA
ncbi:hypothetical protein [Nonomuraea sp. KM90]|uniref:hypothetical protein n=1 Tax=Nonomuraea sp. KM90 TaxID=3457428 RepID=UPI003FCD3DA3